MTRSSLSPFGALLAEIRESPARRDHARDEGRVSSPVVGTAPELDLRIETRVVSAPRRSTSGTARLLWPASVLVHAVGQARPLALLVDEGLEEDEEVGEAVVSGHRARPAPADEEPRERDDEKGCGQDHNVVAFLPQPAHGGSLADGTWWKWNSSLRV